MSLVNSLINQIGREMGRDIYWTARQSLTQSSKPRVTRNSTSKSHARNQDYIEVAIDSNESLRNRITLLNLGSISNRSMRKFEIEKILDDMDTHLNPRSFNWREAYSEMDNKLDELKFQVDKDELPEIEQFDKRNYIMFSVSNNQHIKWIEGQVAELKKSPYYGLSYLGTLNLIGWSLVGLASLPLKREGLNRGAEFFAAILWISAAIVVMNSKEFGIHEPIIVYGISIFAIFLFLLIISGNFILRNERDAKVEYIANRVKILEDYLAQINKPIL